eukprot:5440616-Prymnesium_polylepis.1
MFHWPEGSTGCGPTCSVQRPPIRMRFPPECAAIYQSNPCPWRTHLISGPEVRRRDPTCGSLDAPSATCTKKERFPIRMRFLPECTTVYPAHG